MSDTLSKPKAEAATPCLSMRPREAAKALGVSERTLWGWTAAGEVPHVRIGRAILYPTDSLRRWLDDRAAKATEGGDHDPR